MNDLTKEMEFVIKNLIEEGVVLSHDKILASVKSCDEEVEDEEILTGMKFNLVNNQYSIMGYDHIQRSASLINLTQKKLVSALMFCQNGAVRWMVDGEYAIDKDGLEQLFMRMQFLHKTKIEDVLKEETGKKEKPKVKKRKFSEEINADASGKKKKTIWRTQE